MRRLIPLLALALVVPAVGAVVPGVPVGFTVTPLAPVAVPTALAFGPGDGDGPDLYAATVAGNVLRLHLAWTAGVPAVTDSSIAADGFGLPLGVAFDGDALFVSDSTSGAESGRTDGRVTRIDSDGTRTVIVDGLPNGRHNTNHLRFGPDGLLYITNGNPNDNGIDGGDADVLPYSGAILSVDADEVTASPAIFRWVDANGSRIPDDAVAMHAVNADFRSKVDVFAAGLRNVFGVAFHPETGVGYTATNGADEPSSQDAFYKIDAGTDYGFPFCYNDGLPGATGSDVTKRNNPLFPDHDCSAYPPADALLGWHVCATGIDFPTEGQWAFPAEYANSAFVGECATFFAPDMIAQTLADGVDTLPRSTSHKVSRVALDANGHATRVEDFLDGLALPTDVLFGPEGAMYVADAEGVLRVAPAVPAGTL